MDSVRLLGLRIDRVTMESALGLIEQFIAARNPRHLITADASMVVIAQSDPELKAIVEQADIVTPDGFGILWAARKLKMPVTDKVSGVDLVGELARLSAEKGYRLYFLGAAPGVADHAARNLEKQFPGAKIVGCHDGYFDAGQEAEIVAGIKATQPDVLFVAMGIPKQEKWINHYLNDIGASVSIGIGGSFDVYSGRVRRAPVWMQRKGLEWLYRLWTNPRKIAKVMTLPKFAIMTIRQVMSAR